jgi:very-short-patch-repair endonuclease
MSLPEVMLWQRLRGNQTGFRFRRQHPIGVYIADFYSSTGSTVIEVDGELHGPGDRPQRDDIRDAFLRENGYRVLRMAAADILRDVDGAVASIVSFVASPLHHASHVLERDRVPRTRSWHAGDMPKLSHPPRSGED